MSISKNNTDLQNILNTINNLPNAPEEVEQATPSISVDSAGKITATATQSAGYVSAGTKTGTKQLTTQAARTVTPSTSSQTAVASGVYTTGAITVAAIPSTYVKPSVTKTATTYTPTTSDQTIAAGTYCSGAQTIKGDANLVAENIKSGVSIFGVPGSFESIGGDTSGGASKETCSVSLSNDLGGFACTYLSSNDDSLVYIPDFFNETLSTYKNSKLIILSNQYFSDIGFRCDSDASYTEEYSAIGAVTTFTLTEDSHYIHFYEEDPFGGWG